jgi:hypothetical protein
MAYGMTRVPNDVDIVVLDSTSTAEEIKRRLVSVNPSFFLVSSTNPRNTYKILWYNLGAQSYPPSHACKVDILMPGGDLNIPSIPNQFINYCDLHGYGLVPVMPFIPLLLLKLQGWSDHRKSYRVDLRQKQYMDVCDINELLQLAVRDHKVDVRKGGWLPSSFVEMGKLRAGAFVTASPSSRVHWSQINLLPGR